MPENNSVIANEESEIDLIDIGSTLLREKFLILLITLISTSVSTLYFRNVKPVWRGSFNVVVRDSQEGGLSGLDSFSDLISNNSNQGQETQRLILESPLVLMPVFEYARDYYLPNTQKKMNTDFKSWIKRSVNISFEDNSTVLNITYKDKDKELILDVLNLISEKYQDYSKRDRIKSLVKNRAYLESQKKIMEEKSRLSKNAFNTFTIENSLGNIKSYTQPNSSDNSPILNPGIPNNSIYSEDGLLDIYSGSKDISKKNPTEKFDLQFSLLERYETEYVNLSSKLKANSKTLTTLRNKIETLKSALKRPNEILIEYDELYRDYIKDEEILGFIERNLEIIKLEQVKVPDPWEMISTPTLENSPIFPKKTNLFILSLIVSFIIGSFIGFIKEKITKKVFKLTVFQKIINCDYLDTLFKKEKKLSIKQIINLTHNDNYKGNYRLGIINYKKKVDSDFIDEITSERNDIKLLDFLDYEKIKDFNKLILILEAGKYTSEDLKVINKYISLSKEKIIGWFFINDN